jgi:ribosomal protein S18 acetylase RimI-like enzyme
MGLDAPTGSLRQMDESTLRSRLWNGFARLQALLGHHSMQGAVFEGSGYVASVVPAAPESPTLNAIVALDPEQSAAALPELAARWRAARIRRWGVWIDPAAKDVVRTLQRSGLSMTASAPGMGAVIDELPLPVHNGAVPRMDLPTVGHVNDLAYGNVDQRLERTLAPLPRGVLLGYGASLDGMPASVALALHTGEDCGFSFVATAPGARRRGLATLVMRGALIDARKQGLTTTTLQATDAGERLYRTLGFTRLCDMQLWERRQ